MSPAPTRARVNAAWQRRWCGAAVALVGSLLALPAPAHQSGNSYLTIESSASSLSVQIDLPVRDLDNLLRPAAQHPVAQAADRSVEFTPARLAQVRESLSAVITRSLVIEAGARPLALAFVAQSVRLRNDGLYVRQSFTAPALAPQEPHLVVRYQFFNPGQPLARAYTRLVIDGRELSAVFDPATPVQRFAAREASRWQTLQLFAQEGALHIWGGPDHLLFLACLLLPGLALVGAGAASRWSNARPALLFALKVISAFTLAHSLTLGAAALGWVELPVVLVESVIALSIMVAAALNLARRGHARPGLLAFGFGLIHGLGFANGLRELGLAHGHFLESLLAFNVGVEFGQLAAVAGLGVLLLPWLDRAWVRQGLAKWASLLVLPLAGIWLVQRLAA
jgi:HupE / UreJ protein